MKERNFFRLFSLSLISSWLLFFALAPFLFIVVTSLLTRDINNFVSIPFTFANYSIVLEHAFQQAFLNSMYLGGGATILCLLVAYPFAYFLANVKEKYRGILLLLVIIPFWTNSLIRTYALVFILKTKGLLNNTLLALGLINEPFEIYYTEVAIFIGLVYTLLPFMVLPLYSTLSKMDKTLLEAANDLGANKFRSFFHITLPLSVPGIVAGCSMVFLPALGMFYVPDILGGGRELLLGNYVKSQFLNAQNWPEGAATGVFMTAIMGLLFLLYKFSTRKTESKGVFYE